MRRSYAQITLRTPLIYQLLHARCNTYVDMNLPTFPIVNGILYRDVHLGAMGLKFMDSLPEYCATIQSCLIWKPSLVEFVHHRTSFPSWL